MTLTNDSMTMCNSERDEKSPDQIVTPESNNTDEAPRDDEDGDAKDLEWGNEENETKHEIGENSGNYTHVLVPAPGHDVDGNDAADYKANSTEKTKKRKHGLFTTRRAKDDTQNTTTELESSNKQMETRAAPIFCAVCLMEYETSERVCWSSNSECTHVFHEDCILQWLTSLGKTKSKRQWFPQEPSERNLLCYELECPCCRQDFIAKYVCAGTRGDENV
jgi:hypothetical protein